MPQTGNLPVGELNFADSSERVFSPVPRYPDTQIPLNGENFFFSVSLDNFGYAVFSVPTYPSEAAWVPYGKNFFGLRKFFDFFK